MHGDFREGKAKKNPGDVGYVALVLAGVANTTRWLEERQGAPVFYRDDGPAASPDPSSHLIIG
jgi:hypothetical protein